MDNYNTSGGFADLNNSDTDLAAIIDDLENDNNLPRPTFPANPAEPTEFEVENLLNETLAETNENELETLANLKKPRNLREFPADSVQPNTPGSLKRKTRADNEEDEEMTPGWISPSLHARY